MVIRSRIALPGIPYEMGKTGRSGEKDHVGFFIIRSVEQREQRSAAQPRCHLGNGGAGFGFTCRCGPGLHCRSLAEEICLERSRYIARTHGISENVRMR